MATRTMALVLVVLTALATATRADTTVNASIGDASWIAIHGMAPDGSVDEIARIRTHLAYVTAELRHRVVAPANQHARDAALVALERYADLGQFPRRTGDRFVGRRPRFIDDRGVRCAVGELIAQSGHAELARSIDAEYEYAFVRDMTSPALAQWADANGFTLEELAMIQPSYAEPPTAQSTKRDIEDAKDAITIACASQAPALTKISLEVFGLKSGDVKVGTTSTTPFARCFVARASSRGGGAYDKELHAYQFSMDLSLTSPQQLFDRAVASLRQADNCTPRPGAVVRRAPTTSPVTSMASRSGSRRRPRMRRSRHVSRTSWVVSSANIVPVCGSCTRSARSRSPRNTIRIAFVHWSRSTRATTRPIARRPKVRRHA